VHRFGNKRILGYLSTSERLQGRSVAKNDLTRLHHQSQLAVDGVGVLLLLGRHFVGFCRIDLTGEKVVFGRLAMARGEKDSLGKNSVEF
jgi:hypothetical protein